MTHLPKTFAALADPTRFAIVERLLASGSLPAGAFLDIGNMSPPAISRHLKTLREAGVIAQQVQGTKRIYSMRPDALQEISDWTISHRKFWDNSLNRLDAALADYQENIDD